MYPYAAILRYGEVALKELGLKASYRDRGIVVSYTLEMGGL